MGRLIFTPGSAPSNKFARATLIRRRALLDQRIRALSGELTIASRMLRVLQRQRHR
jgi:hypothetical protein